MFKEFRNFIMRGNVLDLAVAVIIGAAFGKIVTSLVNDILMPPLGLVLKNVDFSNLFIDVSGGSFKTLAEAKAAINSPAAGARGAYSQKEETHVGTHCGTNEAGGE